SLLVEHDLFRKPVSTPDQVRGRLFRDHALAAAVRLTQAILNCVIRRAVVKRLKGWVGRGISAIASSTPAELKPKLRSALHRRPVVAPIRWRAVVTLVRRAVTGAVLWHTSSPVVIHTPSATVCGVGDGPRKR